MKILAVSDQVDNRAYSFQVKQRFSDIDLLVGCGDLPYEYLEFLVAALNVPLVYVPGNHDPRFDPGRSDSQVAGGVCLDGRLVRLAGLSLAGTGGSLRYTPGRPNQYGQGEMYARLGRMLPALAWDRLVRRRPLDVLVAHSPPLGTHDEDDPAHTGFAAYRDLIRLFRPRYFLHGHVIYYKNNLEPPATRLGDTWVVNVFPCRVIEVPLP
jgi:Icc-related predicted phosphoesterase